MKQKPVSSTYVKTFLQCPQKFYYKYQDKKVPVVSGDARAFGIAAHEALEKMYERLSNPSRLPKEEDYNYVYKVFLSCAIDNGLVSQELYDEGRQILKARLDSFDPSEKVLGLELRFGFPGDGSLQVSTSGGTPLMGAIDKVVELDKDTIVVIDYKSSRTALTTAEAAVDEQLSLYDVVVHKIYPKYKNIIIVLDYLRLSPVITHRTEEQRATFELFLDEVYDKIGRMDESSIKPMLNEFCGWCDYRSYCPKYSEYIKDENLLIKPLGGLTDEEFVEEWDRFLNVRRIVTNYDRELKMHAVNISRGDSRTTIAGESKVLYQTQVSRVYYNPKTILDVIPKEDCVRLMSVKKADVDKYLSDRPEYYDAISKTMSIEYQSPYFKIRAKKDNG